MRAAASSNASGMPSSRRTTSAIAATFASVNSKSDCTETARAINKARGVTVRHRLSIGVLRQREGWHDHNAFSGDAEALAAGREHGHPRAALLELMNELDDGVEQVLAIVEHEQQLLPSQVNHEGVEELYSSTLRHAEDCRDRVDHDVRIPNSSQFHQPGAVAELREHLLRHVARQPSLADSTHAGQGHEPLRAQHRRELRRLALPTHERTVLYREVPQPRLQRLQRGKDRRQTRCDDLEDVHRLLEIPQSVLTQAHQLDRLVEPVADELLHRSRHEHLPSVSDGRQACRSGSPPSRSSRHLVLRSFLRAGPSGPAGRRRRPTVRRR